MGKEVDYSVDTDDVYSTITARARYGGGRP